MPATSPGGDGASRRLVYFALAAAALFVLICSPEIEGQGLFYDEVHQAPSAFRLVGETPTLFSVLSWGPVPLLNMPYSSAIKPVLYGLWMRLSQRPFTIASWRLSGILLVAAGLFAFCLLTARRLSPLGRGVFLFLFCSDLTILLTSRHDWGPTALSLSLRLLWLGLWVAEASPLEGRPARIFLLGFLPALSIFEKLSNVVLLGPLVLLVRLLRSPGSPGLRWLGAGLAFGSLPLLLVNLRTSGISLLAFADEATGPAAGLPSAAQAVSFVADYLGLGAGALISEFILGRRLVPSSQFVEASFWLVVVSAGVACGFRLDRDSSTARLAGTLSAAYVTVGLLSFVLLPDDWVHHWIAGTPFQYAALALLVDAAIRGELSLRRLPRAGKVVASVLGGAFAMSRIGAFAAVESDLLARRASEKWHPAFTSVAQFAVQNGETATFVAADWGFATQIYALSNGAMNVPELFWRFEHPRERERLLGVLDEHPARPIYALFRAESLHPEITRDVLNGLAARCGVSELPPELSLADLGPVRLRRFLPPGAKRPASARRAIFADGFESGAPSRWTMASP